MNEEFEVVGRLHCVLRDSEGNVKQEWEQSNAIVAQGKTWVASRMAGKNDMEAVISHMAIGTGSASATGLGTVPTGGRKAATPSYPGTAGNASITYTTTFGAGEGTGTITEAGLFNADNNTTLRFSTTMNVAKAAADTLTINWTVSLP